MLDRRQHKLVERVGSCVELHRRIDLDFGRPVEQVDKLGWHLFVVVCIDDRWWLWWLGLVRWFGLGPVLRFDKQLDEDVLISRYMYSV